MTDPNLEALGRAAALVTRLRRRYSGMYPTRHPLAWRATARVARGVRLYQFWCQPLHERIGEVLAESGGTTSDRPRELIEKALDVLNGLSSVGEGPERLGVAMRCLAAAQTAALPAAPGMVDPHDPDVRLALTWEDGYEAGKRDGYADGRGWCRKHGNKNPFRGARAADVVTEREADIYRRGYEHGQRKPLGALRGLLGALANDETGDETRDADRYARGLVDDIDNKLAFRWKLRPTREDIDGPAPVEAVPETSET